MEAQRGFDLRFPGFWGCQMAAASCDRLSPRQVCQPHSRIPVWKRFLFSAFGVLLVIWWPIANRVRAGAGIQEVEAVIFGTGVLFLVIGVGSWQNPRAEYH